MTDSVSRTRNAYIGSRRPPGGGARGRIWIERKISPSRIVGCGRFRGVERPNFSTIAAQYWTIRRAFTGRDRRRADAGYLPQLHSLVPKRSLGMRFRFSGNSVVGSGILLERCSTATTELSGSGGVPNRRLGTRGRQLKRSGASSIAARGWTMRRTFTGRDRRPAVGGYRERHSARVVRSGARDSAGYH
jgi:hypothetical protein